MRVCHKVICGGCIALLSVVAWAQIPAPFGIKLGTVMSAATNTVESPVDRRKELLRPREIYTGPDMMFRKSLYSNPITISVPLPTVILPPDCIKSPSMVRILPFKSSVPDSML